MLSKFHINNAQRENWLRKKEKSGEICCKRTNSIIYAHFLTHERIARGEGGGEGGELQGFSNPFSDTFN